MHTFTKSSRGTLAAATAMIAASCGLGRADQIGVWQFNDSLANGVAGGSSLSPLGGWAPAYATETIAGSPARVMSFPAFDYSQSLQMPNDADPNGVGLGTNNNWTLVMDVKFPTLGSYTSLFETDSLASGDGDYFIDSSGGLGIASQYGGTVNANTWTRIAVTVDTVTSPGEYFISGYVDGVLAGTALTGTSPGGRHAVKSVLHLFADDDAETNAGLLNSVAYYGVALNDLAIGALGGASAAGIPSAANQVGRWNFDGNMNNAINGRAAMSAVGAWTPSYASETIGGSPATVLAFPAFDDTVADPPALDMPNEATPDFFLNATTTNSWSIVMDVKFPTLNTYTSLWNTETPAETDTDGEYFILDESGTGTGAGIGIDGEYAGAFNANTWTRLAVTVDGSTPGGAYIVKGYIDGALASTSTVSTAPNGREAIADILHLFADNDDETAAGLINSLAYYDEVLSASAIAALGGATASGIAVTPPIDTDFDNDGDTDGADLLLWQRNLGKTTGATNGQGDADGNGAVNAADLAAWKSKFGLPGVAAAGAVPEPASVLMAALTLGAAIGDRRRK